MFIYTHNQPASRNAKQLRDQRVEVVRAAKKSNENLSYLDVYQATRLTSHAMRAEFGGTAARLQFWIAVGGLVIVAVGGAVAAILLR